MEISEPRVIESNMFNNDITNDMDFDYDQT